MAFNTLPTSRSSQKPTLDISRKRRSDSITGYEERCAAVTLSEYRLEEVEIQTGKVIGTGAYGAVIEVKFRGEFQSLQFLKPARANAALIQDKDHPPGLTCAGKRLHDTFFEEASPRGKSFMLQRFEAECQILSELHHPCIVQFLGIHYEEDSTVPLLVMEYLHMTLSGCVDRYGTLRNEIAYPILHDVVLGLCYLHGHKPNPIIHRDLSANNVLLTTDMRAKISDLGVAKIVNLSPSQKSTTCLQLTTTPGTPAYMPPEAMVQNPRYNTKIDIFSFGVLLLHVFCGHWPFPRAAVVQDPLNPDKVIARTESERREEYFQEMGLNHPLAGLVKQCLHNNQQRRPDANALMNRIEEKQRLIVPTISNKVESIDRITQLKKDNDHLKLQVAALETENQILRKKHEEDSDSLWSSHLLDTARDRSGSQQSNLDFQLESVVMASGSLHSMDQVTEVHHPCQPGAKLIWSKNCTDLPVAMYHAHAVVMGNTIYTGGGCTKGSDDIVFKYELQLDQWERLPSCPVTYFGLAKLENRLVALGGITASKGISNTVYSFDVNAQTWKNTIPSMPTARHSLTAISFQLSLIACGGKDATGVSNSVEVFRLEAGLWYQVHPLPFPCYHMSATVIHGFCYFLGGFDQYAFTDKVVYASLPRLLENSVSYNSKGKHAPLSKSPWHSLRSIRYSCATAANLGGCLLAIGGVRAIGSAKVCIYSQLKNTWVKLTSLLHHDAYLGPSVAELPNGELLIIGGAKSNLDPQTTVYKGHIYYS